MSYHGIIFFTETVFDYLWELLNDIMLFHVHSLQNKRKTLIIKK